MNGFIDLNKEVVAQPDTGIFRQDTEADINDNKKWPLTSDQQRIWFLDRMNPGNPALNIAAAIRIKGQLRVDVLNISYSYLMNRHDLLRAYIIMEDDKVFQAIKEIVPVMVPVAEIGENDIHIKLKEEAAKSFNLFEGDLSRIKLFKITENDQILFFNVHHIIADAWSLGILMDDFLKIYFKLSTGKDTGIEDLKSKYLDFIEYQSKIINKNYEKQITYWKENLNNVPTRINLPYDFERPQTLTYKAGQIHFELNSEVVRSIKKISVESNVTIFNFLYPAFTCFIFLVSGQKEFLVGCPIANRKLPDFNKILGFFTNTLVLKNRFSDDQDIMSLMKETYNTNLNAFNNSDIPYMSVVQEITFNREFNINPLFQMMFSLLQVYDYPARDGYSFENIKLFSGYSDYDIFLTIEVNNKTIEGFFNYSTDVFQETTAQLLVSGFISILQQITQNPDLKINRLQIPGNLQKVIDDYRVKNYKQQIIISSTFSDQPIKDVVSFWMDKIKMPSDVILADYNQVFNQLLDSSQSMRMNKDGVNILLIRLEDWIRYSDHNTENNNSIEKIKSICDDFKRVLPEAVKNFSVPVIVSILPSKNKSDLSAGEIVDLLSQDLADKISQIDNVYLLKTDEIHSQYHIAEIFDDLTDQEAHLPFTEDFYKALGTCISRKIYNIKKNPFKVIVLDCDNTLWQGVIGEDGIEKIEIDPARTAFQKLIIEQQENGMLICLVSKNDETDVLKVFREKPEMALKLEHITIIKANWESKSRNVAEIARELNLGIDSFIFVDDNPVECAELSSTFDEILTVQFPQEQEKIMALIKNGWFWDHLKITEEDKARTSMYKAEMERKKEIEKHITFEDFYNSLRLEIVIEKMKDEDISRVSQLTHRTNQFNTTTIRRSTNEINEFLSNERNNCLTVRVSDRFGAYGLVGVAFYTLFEDHINVESLILSCRTLGKGVEHRMMNHIAELAINNNVNDIRIPFYFSKKNMPAFNFLNGLQCLKRNIIENGELFYSSAKQMVDLKFDTSIRDVIRDSEIKSKNKQSNSRKFDKAILNFIFDLSDIKYIEIKSSKGKGTTGSIVEAENEVQEKIISMVKDTLNIDRISIDQNFFDLGGYSLQLVQLLSKIQREFDQTIQITDLFQYTNIRKLADYLMRGDADSKLKQVKERGEQQRQRLMALQKTI